MKKRVFKRKKETILHGGKGPGHQRTTRRAARSAKVLAFAAALSLVLGSVITVYGEEAGGGGASAVLRTVVTDIVHKHVGNPDSEGGCYTQPIAHTHRGDPAGGGGCYTKPVPHGHTGSPEAGGGCYGEEIPHTVHGLECYRTETHTHDSDCYSGQCTITYTEKELIETYTDTCLDHGVTTHERRATTAFHSDCGLGEVDTVREQCQSCVNSLTRTHTYLNCGKQEGPEEILDCNKTIDGYRLTCGYEEGGAESYELECGVTVDGYGTGCEMEESEPCGRLILTSQAGSDNTKVIISAKVEDLTDGKLILGSDPYIWRDQDGNLVGKGESLEVEKNGDYTVLVSLENKDVDESGLHSSILVDNFHKGDLEKPTATPSVSPSASPEATPGATSSPTPAGVPSQSPEPSAVPENTPDHGAGEGEEGNTDDNEEEEGSGTTDSDPGNGNIEGTGTGKETLKGQSEEGALRDMSGHKISSRLSYYEKRDQSGADEIKFLISPSPSPEEKLKKDTTTATVSGNNAADNRQYKVGQQAKRNSFFQSKAVRILTVTASTLLVLAGIALLLFYLMCSVRVFNDDGEGRMVYLGRCLVRKKDEEYSLVITEPMTERACTNRYCIKPGLFRLGKKEDQELIVYRDDKKAVTYLDKEMIVIL